VSADGPRADLGHRVAVDPFEPSTGIDERLLRRVLDDALEAESTQRKRRSRRGRARLRQEPALLERLDERSGQSLYQRSRVQTLVDERFERLGLLPRHARTTRPA